MIILYVLNPEVSNPNPSFFLTEFGYMNPYTLSLNTTHIAEPAEPFLEDRRHPKPNSGARRAGRELQPLQAGEACLVGAGFGV